MGTAREFDEVRRLVEQNGFLPVHGKANAVLQEVNRLTDELGSEATLHLRKLQAELEQQGYLPASKAQQLLDAIDELRC